jgi:hypothetical protein
MDMNQENVKKAVAESGGFIIVPMIDMEGNSPLVIHTVGLTDKYGCPELVVTAVPEEISVGLIHYVVEQMVAKGGRFADKEELPLPEEMPADARPIAVRDALKSEIAAYPFMALRMFYGDREFELQQITMPDMNQVMPWEDGFYPGALDTQRMFWFEGGVQRAIPGLSPDVTIEGFWHAEGKSSGHAVPDAPTKH